MKDKFGNEIDPKVGYARGVVLRSAAEESLRTIRGRRLVKERVAKYGADNLYNLTGLIRGFPLDQSHLDGLRSQFGYYANFDGWPEAMAVRTLGGDETKHSGLIMNRVSAGTFALMATVLAPGDIVLSVVPRGRSHPSVERAVTFRGGIFCEVVGRDGLRKYLEENEQPAWSVISPITHEKFHFDLPDLLSCVRQLADAGVPIFLDDAHMSARVAGMNQPRSFELGPVSASIVSTDKHMFGPRAGALVAERQLLARIRTFAFELGLEAQAGHAVAAGVAMERHDPAPIKEAVVAGNALFQALNARYGDVVYPTGVGAAINEQDILSLAAARRPDLGARAIRIAPVDASNVLAMALLVDYGVATIPVVGMPGSSPALRLMTFPDGARFGVEALVQSVDAAISKVAEYIDNPEEAAAVVLG